jgi:hypothetical protein
VAFYKQASIMASMVMLVWQDGDGFLVRDLCSRVHPVTDAFYLVINGVISLPIAVAAYFFLPDTPGTAKPNWIFTERVSLSSEQNIG